MVSNRIHWIHEVGRTVPVNRLNRQAKVCFPCSAGAPRPTLEKGSESDLNGQRQEYDQGFGWRTVPYLGSSFAFVDIRRSLSDPFSSLPQHSFTWAMGGDYVQ